MGSQKLWDPCPVLHHRGVLLSGYFAYIWPPLMMMINDNRNRINKFFLILDRKGFVTSGRANQKAMRALALSGT